MSNPAPEKLVEPDGWRESTLQRSWHKTVGDIEMAVHKQHGGDYYPVMMTRIYGYGMHMTFPDQIQAMRWCERELKSLRGDQA